MNMFFRYLMVVITLFATAGCSKRLDETSLPTYIRINDIYYTQASLPFENGKYLTTNYRRGVLLPINTQVILQEITDDEILLEILSSHAKLRIENVQKHTGDTTTQAFPKLLAKNKVDLSSFSELEREKINAGQVANGMRKKAVIAAIGYPPITETLTLESNQWTYWSSRFNRFIVYFENDRVTRIQD